MSTATQKRGQSLAFRLPEFDAVAYIDLILPASRGANESRMNPNSDQSAEDIGPRFTGTQGQYLAFIYAYTRVFGRPPAEADMQRHFKVTAPSIHQMVLSLERNGLVKRRPGISRSIEILIDPEKLPALR
jgi:DNA-binding MarR family transcriptional regulator